MLRNYLLDIFIMMLNNIVPYNEFSYATNCTLCIITLYKITSISSRINFAKTHHSEIESVIEY